jgi:hypothetical protein
MKVANVLRVGDTVYSSGNGKPMKVTKVYSDGFDTEDDYYGFGEHRELFWLTRVGYQASIEKEGAEE